MVSTVRDKDIKKLQEAGYLAKRISHRLPTAGQIVPTPEPHERVVFLPHFVRGLGFPLHPFVRGIILWDRSSRSVPQFLPQHLDIHCRVRGFSPHLATFWLMAEDFQCKVQGSERQAC